MTKSTLPANFLASMNVSAEVGMNEVVSMFVTKYEDGLVSVK